MEPLFPSYVFVETDRPQEFFAELKRVPRMSRFLGVDGCFWGIYEEEELFLRRLMEEGRRKGVKESCKDDQQGSYMIYPSLVWVDEEGQILRAEGILKFYIDQIVKQRLRKRSVIIEIPFGGRLRRIRLGIRLAEDTCRVVSESTGRDE